MSESASHSVNERFNPLWATEAIFTARTINVSIKQSQSLHKSLYSAAAFKKQRAGKTNLFYIRGGRFHAFNT